MVLRVFVRPRRTGRAIASNTDHTARAMVWKVLYAVHAAVPIQGKGAIKRLRGRARLS